MMIFMTGTRYFESCESHMRPVVIFIVLVR